MGDATVAPELGSAQWREALESLLGDASTADLLKALSPILEARGLVLREQTDAAVPLLSNLVVGGSLKSPANERLQKASVLPLEATPTDKLMFMMKSYICEADDPKVDVHVVRLGNRTSTSSVHFKTVAGSAKAGQVYAETSGSLTFQPGESSKTISVPLLDERRWLSTQDFFVSLSDATEADLAVNLRVARIRVINTHIFPSNRCKKHLNSKINVLYAAGNEGHVQAHSWAHMLEYFKLNLRSKTVLIGSLKCVVADQVCNGMMFGKIFVQMYLVDNILTKYTLPEHSEAPVSEYMMHLTVVAVIYLAFVALDHLLDYRRCFWKVGGTSRHFLQANLVKKYVTYTDSSRSQVPPSILLNACTSASPRLVTEGFGKLFPILKGVGNILLLAIFQVSQIGIVGLVPFVVCPLLVVIFTKLRAKTTSNTMINENRAEIELIDHVGRTSDNVRLLTDYSQRVDAVERFEATVRKRNSAMTNAAAVNVNNEAFPAWMREVLVTAFIVSAGHYIISQDESLSFLMSAPRIGAFLATVQVINNICASFTVVFNSFFKMIDAFTHLNLITWLLNLPTEERGLMVQSRRVLANSEQAWSVAQARNFVPEFKEFLSRKCLSRALDTIPIKVEGVKVQFEGSLLELCFDCEIWQGELVAVVGKGVGSGRNTFLKMLAGVMTPANGMIFIPSHLRVLHVTGEPLFLNKRNLLANLCLGLPASDHEKAIPRVHAILKQLGLDDDVLSLVCVDGKARCWSQYFSRQSCQLLNLARALIPSPEVMIVHNPLVAIAPKYVMLVESALRSFVDERGLMEDGGRFLQRHPRTCVMSLNDFKQTEVVTFDRVLEVGNGSMRTAGEDLSIAI
eukprot:TRINITY_DN4055_c0_g1_i1.p1 TRINITY_DN4055_c0_g1~~TRINITY_DN4055_c0_g1_i1.p1  ORF type:complete len:853 (-),score=99.62 TRINITY_DN4055_c0_g1_i1:245-2803(-)